MLTDQSKIKFQNSGKVVTTEQIFNGHVLDLYVNKMDIDGQIVERELVHRHPGVGVLAFTPDEKIVFVKQYRPAVDEYLMEMPAGLIDLVEGEFEEPLITAKRELEEETAYQAANWEKIGEFYVSPGALDEKLHLYVATDLVRVDNPLPQDEDEQIELIELEKAEVLNLLKTNQIKDAKTVIALQYWLLNEE
ncbi:NUDIX hydrolase [Aerococcaceae bacterium DSM 111022]|nr:NUDIX hydrolase [Aerococcaceae bacterium DSM 111022]